MVYCSSVTVFLQKGLESMILCNYHLKVQVSFIVLQKQ